MDEKLNLLGYRIFRMIILFRSCTEVGRPQLSRKINSNFTFPTINFSQHFFHSVVGIFLKYFFICFRNVELRQIVSGCDFLLNHGDFRQRNEILMSLMIGNMNKPIFADSREKVSQYYQYKHNGHSSRSTRLFTLVSRTMPRFLNIGKS